MTNPNQQITTRLTAGGIETMVDPNKVRLVGFSELKVSNFFYGGAFWQPKKLVYTMTIDNPEKKIKVEDEGSGKRPLQNIQESLKKLNLFLANIRSYRPPAYENTIEFYESLTGDLYEENGATR